MPTIPPATDEDRTIDLNKIYEYVRGFGPLDGPAADYLKQCARLIRRCYEAEQQVAELRSWKESAAQVESEWDCQAVARELNLPLGCSIRAELLPAIQALKQRVSHLEQVENASLRVELKILRDHMAMSIAMRESGIKNGGDR